jgi:NAD+ kinase
MKVGLYGREFGDAFIEPVEGLVEALVARGFSLRVDSGFHTYLSGRINLPDNLIVFSGHDDLVDFDCLISVGGDGTMLDTMQLVGDSGTPILGVNTGRLGFLSNVSIDDIRNVADLLLKKQYEIDSRVLIEASGIDVDSGKAHCALNEVTLHKKDTSSMIRVRTYVNDVFMNTYWADGLIVSTPTGSTAYSLSCGGPIVMPTSRNFVLTPIAPHNLNVRPVVISDDNTIRLIAESREPNVLLTLDSRSISLSAGTEVTLKKASHNINLISFPEQDFFGTIRQKLMWGIDRRN